MKKQYIEPNIVMLDIADEEFCQGPLSTSETEVNSASLMETKERETVDFSSDCDWDF